MKTKSGGDFVSDAAFKLYGALGEGEDCRGKIMNLILGRMTLNCPGCSGGNTSLAVGKRSLSLRIISLNLWSYINHKIKVI